MFIFSECKNEHGYRQKEDSGGVTCSWEMLTYVMLLCRFALPAPASSRGRRALSSILGPRKLSFKMSPMEKDRDNVHGTVHVRTTGTVL